MVVPTLRDTTDWRTSFVQNSMHFKQRLVLRKSIRSLSTIETVTGLLSLPITCLKLTPLATESHPDNAVLAITPETEALVKEYILTTFFGEVFEVDGEAFNPLNVQRKFCA